MRVVQEVVIRALHAAGTALPVRQGLAGHRLVHVLRGKQCVQGAFTSVADGMAAEIG